MEIPLSLIFLGVLVFVSYTAQAMTGFGSIVIALTIGALFFEMRTILPVLVALNLPLCIWILYRGFRAIDTSVLFQKILPLMGAGVALGVLVSQTWDGPLLRRLFGGIIAAFALRELVFLLFFQNKTQKPLHKAAGIFWIFAAGVVHGIYASGGPPLVYALSRTPMNRAAFRATLTAVWLILNAALFVVYILNGTFTMHEGLTFLYLLPTIPLALKVGGWLHTRVSEWWFRISLQSLLLLSAAALLF